MSWRLVSFHHAMDVSPLQSTSGENEKHPVSFSPQDQNSFKSFLVDMEELAIGQNACNKGRISILGKGKPMKYVHASGPINPNGETPTRCASLLDLHILDISHGALVHLKNLRSTENSKEPRQNNILSIVADLSKTNNENHSVNDRLQHLLSNLQHCISSWVAETKTDAGTEVAPMENEGLLEVLKMANHPMPQASVIPDRLRISLMSAFTHTHPTKTASAFCFWLS